MSAQVSPLSPREIIDVRQAMDLLDGTGLTLLDAARMAANAPRATGPLVSDAIEQWLASRKERGCRAKTLSTYRYYMRALESCTGDLRVHEIAPEVVAAAIGRTPDSADNRANCRRYWRSFFAWCLKRGWLVENPAGQLEAPIREERAPEILTVGQGEALFKALSKYPQILPVMAVTAFSGVRTAEASRLTWRAVGAEFITLDGEAAKLRQRRHVSILPNLRAWLDSVSRETDLLRAVSNKEFSRQAVEAKEAAGLSDWPRNALRHSFASYHLAAFGDPAKTAIEMGHSDQAMLYRHYREVVTREAGQAWFGIRP